MRCLIDQHTAALAAPGSAPGALVVVALRTPPVRDDPVRPADGADFPVVDDLLESNVERVVALVEHDAEAELRVRLGEGIELLHLLGIDTGRLFDQRVHPAGEGVDAHLRVQKVRNAGDDGVDLAALQQLKVVVVKLCSRVLGGDNIRFGRVGVGDRGDHHIGHEAIGDELGIHRTLGAEPDDSEANPVGLDVVGHETAFRSVVVVLLVLMAWPARSG